jgi:hypothetical protein
MDKTTKDDLTKDHIISIMDHIGDEERHFNELEKGYRLLASQWLLGSFGAMGYMLQLEKNILVDKLAFISIIAFVSCIGIFLLWLIDIKVYHKLLNSCFMQGVKLEEDHDWLPKIRTTMLLGQSRTGDVVSATGLYYIVSCTLLIIISATSLCFYFEGDTTAVCLVAVTGAISAVALFAVMARSVKNLKAASLRTELSSKYKYESGLLVKK